MSAPTLGGAEETQPIHAEGVPPARVVVNSAWMMLSQGVVTVIGGAVSIYAIRSFTASTWGHYSTAVALVALLAIFSGPGLAPLALREMTSAPDRQAEILGTAFQALAFTCGGAAIGLFAATMALGYPHEVVVLALILAPLLFLDPALANLAAAFNARSQLVYVAISQILQSVVYGAIAVFVIAAALGVAGLALATVAGALCATVIALVLLRAKLHVRPRLNQPPRGAWLFLLAAIPIAGINLVAIVYARIDILLLSLLADSKSVALYTVPYALVRLSWVLPSVVAAAFFPTLSRTLAVDRAEARTLFFLVVRVFLFLSVPISLLLAIGAPTVLPFMYGDTYRESVPVLEIMAWTSVFGFQNYVLWYGLLAAHKERIVLVIQVAGLGVNVALNAYAIPAYGARGAAAALVVSDLVVVVAQAWLVHRHLFEVPAREILLKPIGAALVIVPVALLVATRSSLGGALAGAIAYVTILLALRYVTAEEWKPVAAVARAPLAVFRRGPGPA